MDDRTAAGGPALAVAAAAAALALASVPLPAVAGGGGAVTPSLSLAPQAVAAAAKAPAPESDGLGAGGNALAGLHKGFGYATAVAGLASLVLGTVVVYDYHEGIDVPWHKAAHRASSHALLGLGLAALVTGLVRYNGLLAMKRGAAHGRAHAWLGLVAAAAILVSTVIGYLPRRDGAGRDGKDYAGHCAISAVAGTALFASILALELR